MSTKTEDVEAAKGRLQAYADRQRVTFNVPDLRTLLASHTAQAERIASLEAFVRNVAEPHHSSDHYSMATAFERFQTRARALLSGKASA